MDEIQKALARLTPKERERIKHTLKRLEAGVDAGLDIQKLKGREDIFRVRKGDMRIIYRKTQDQIFILAIERRRERTYKC